MMIFWHLFDVGSFLKGGCVVISSKNDTQKSQKRLRPYYTIGTAYHALSYGCS